MGRPPIVATGTSHRALVTAAKLTEPVRASMALRSSPCFLWAKPQKIKVNQ
jgi:hypothetical protein